MDVRCEKCSSEDEFDEARIPDTELAVKCSSCGNVFRVFRTQAAPGQHDSHLPDSSGGEWMIRQASGNVFTCKQLTTLQRWIVERKVVRADEISKTGRNWKRLGDIAELATFFQVVDVQQPQPVTLPSTPSQPMAHPQSMPQAHSQPMAQPMPMRQPMPMAQEPSMPQYGGRPQQPMAHPAQQGGSNAAQAAWEQNPQALSWNQPSGNCTMGQPTGGGQTNIDLQSFPPQAVDDFDDFELKRGGAGKWIVALSVLIIGAGGA